MGQKRRGSRVRRGLVLWPLVTGVARCGLGLWSVSATSRRQAAFRADAVPARAAIGRIYPGPLIVTPSGAASFDQFAMVRCGVRGRIAHARVMLVPGCSGVCLPRYHVGQVITVYYSPRNPDYAQLRPPAGRSWLDDGGGIILGFLGLIFLAAAVINVLTAGRAGIAAADPPAEGAA